MRGVLHGIPDSHDDSIQEEDERDELLDLHLVDNDEVDPEEAPTELRPKILHLVIDADLWTKPWMGWCSTYALLLLFFSIYRWSALGDLISMYGSVKDSALSLRVGVLFLGFMEDVVCTTYFACALWIFDLVKQAISVRCKHQGGRQHAAFEKRRRIARITCKTATFLMSWLLFVATVAPFVADMLLVRLREMRFSFDIVTMAINESEYISAAPIATEEFNAGYANAAVVVIVATVFALGRTELRRADLAHWDPTHAVVHAALLQLTTPSSRLCGNKLDQCSGHGYKYDKLTSDEGKIKSKEAVKVPNSNSDVKTTLYRRASQAAVLLLGLVGFPMFVVGVSSSSSPLVAYSALNATLNQLFRQILLPSQEEFKQDPDNPPNVIVLAVESFRYHDSRYLVGQEDPSNLFKGSNITVTPNFDRWAKRGVAFRNMWSSSPTSRSLESILFAQVPYDSVATGTAGGKEDTELSGLPQLFSAKGYETYFTTGCALNYDGWDVFIPSHGYENVWGRVQMWNLAETDMGITPDQWDGPEKRRFPWGVHDDVSFQLVGDLLLNKTKEQNGRIHEPFHDRPTWYAESEKPDFTALYEGLERADTVKNYLEMRYFTDMELGKFMDRMEAEGVLNDTIVVIVGDHGRAPEVRNSDTRDVSVTRVPATIVAEGRLGSSVGLVIDDAVEHYDLLNTLADITGVPTGVFVQNGVGRSLKRKIPFGERVVFSNNPTRKMSVVRGHQRLRYDRVGDSVLLHNADTDHDMQVDLFPNLTRDEQMEWLAWRDIGRDISRYYLERWDGKCLLAVNCTDS
ncbi:hypothetical protein PF004_g10361 [Phytophthora fragariae]|uniref:Sulfatase N-terminal domain-containing protein n=3 Tax=Phytophthora fragariae TaxID=53985 RepID=A0A6G0P161_9STRA|nr:hypothetical protein PF004_g10361 [Phytophthora fragariae]KAE9341486.1 hypothetical protein PF008_g10606 [Phytophthora fragariae]